MSNIPTFSLEDTYPRLPVPPLQQTCSLYLHSLLPFQTPKEHEKSKAVVHDFMNSTLAKSLQERLIDIDRRSPGNWLDDFWLKKAYLETRAPLMVNSNWFTAAQDDPHHPKELLADNAKAFPENKFSYFQIRRAATLAYNGACFTEEILNQTFRVYMFRGRFPVGMYQYSRLLCMSRVPHTGCDELVQQDAKKVHHIVVLACDQVYTLNVFEWVDEKKQRISIDRLEKALLAISSHASSKVNEQKPVPLLTSWDRENWAVARNHLLAVGPVGNRKSLSAIEDALFVISLDNYSNGADSPSYGETGYCGQQNLGQGHNRWFDKPATVILENSGKVMLMGEHSPLDALPVDDFFTYLLRKPMVSASGIDDGENISQFAWLTDAPAPKGAPLESIPIIEHLTWTTDEKVDACLKQAQLAADATFTQFNYYNLWFDDFGNEDVRRVTKLALDPLYQMAIQLTYYRTHSTITPTYETAQTRSFRHGRTETIRVCSMKTKQFVESFDDPEISEKETYDLLVASVEEHKKYTMIASTGRGCDRHLMALRLLNLEHRVRDDSGKLISAPLHPMFTDPIFAKSQTFRLATSGLEDGEELVGNAFYVPFERGYGVTYMSSPKVLKFGITSSNTKNTLPARYFGDALARALHDVFSLCKQFGLNASEQRDKSHL
ncbi:hypothetical protein [Absidia glauca]|uniref:Choline/carnitine acyltransferase domain-containing protein n=1 Tax=Absidia glauca TaxID=4829 RepID=A0A168PG69_ABSGL|nr:hypothetical protein [Absidia glauca]